MRKTSHAFNLYILCIDKNEIRDIIKLKYTISILLIEEGRERTMLYDYIIENYKKDEPIFLSELPGSSRNTVSLQMKKLVDEGKIERLKGGVYYMAYTTILGTKGRMSVDKFIEKKYLKVNGEVSGYITGIQLANMYGFTTQNPSCYEVCSNEASTKQRRIDVDGRKLIIYKPVTRITKDNYLSLQFLDLMSTIDRYSEISGEELKEKLLEVVSGLKVDFQEVKKYISLFPDRVYKNIYQGGLMREMV